jgi:basic membrane lipoprotein Med (substrate-binding protein (PBP1-ABC) superfamily)
MKPFIGSLLLATFLGAACSGGVKDQDAASEVQDDGVFEVALLTPGSVSDAGWNAMAFDGLTAISEELGAKSRTERRPTRRSRTRCVLTRRRTSI